VFDGAQAKKQAAFEGGGVVGGRAGGSEENSGLAMGGEQGGILRIQED